MVEQTQALARNGEAPGLPALPLEADTARLAMAMAKSGYFSDVKDAAQAVVKIIAGKEMGFGPVASMTGIYLVQGKVTVGANLMAAAIKRSGRYSYRVDRLDDTGCVITFVEKGEPIGVSAFTQDDAKKASLLNKSGPWTTFPRNMYFARALSNGCRWYCPDVFGGPIYTPEEMGAKVDDEGNVVHHETETETIPDVRVHVEQPAAIPARTVDRETGEVHEKPPAEADAAVLNAARDLYREAKDAGIPVEPPAAKDVGTLVTWSADVRQRLDVQKGKTDDPDDLDAYIGPPAWRWKDDPIEHEVSSLVDQLTEAGARFSMPADDADRRDVEAWIAAKRGLLKARRGA